MRCKVSYFLLPSDQVESDRTSNVMGGSLIPSTSQQQPAGQMAVYGGHVPNWLLVGCTTKLYQQSLPPYDAQALLSAARQATFNPSVQVQPTNQWLVTSGQQLTNHTAQCTVCTDLSLSGWYIAYFHLRAVVSAGVTRAHTRKPSGHISSPKSPAWGQICQNSEISLSCINWLIKITFIGSKLICPLLQN